MRRTLFVMAVSLLATVAFVGCLKSGGSAGPLDYVPKAAAVTGQVDVTKALAIQAIKEAIIEGEGKQPMAVELKKLGISADTVTKVGFGLDLAKAAEGGEPDIVVIVQLSAPVTDTAKAIEIIKGANPEGDVQFLSNTVMAMGTPGMVSEAVKIGGGTGESVKKNADLMAVSGKGSTSGLLWVAAKIPADQAKKLGAAAGEGAPVKPEQVKSLFLSADYSDAAGLSISAVATLDSEDTVKALLPQLEQAKGMAAMFSGGKVTGEMIKVEQKGVDLCLTVSIPKAVIDELAAQAKGAMGGGAPAPPIE